MKNPSEDPRAALKAALENLAAVANAAAEAFAQAVGPLDEAVRAVQYDQAGQPFGPSQAGCDIWHAHAQGTTEN